MDIRWEPAAVDDLQALHRYISRDNPRAAGRVAGRIRAAVRRIGKQPRHGRPGRVYETRELVVTGTPYLVAYAVIDDSVTILRVIHGAQDWPEAF